MAANATILVCPKCGAKNRVDGRASRLQPVCGRCGEKLADGAPAAGGAEQARPLVVTDQTFARDVLGAGSRPVLLDCWAPWCGPCKMLAPAIDALAAESAGKYVVAKLNTDDSPRVASQFNISSIPAILIFKDGRLVDQAVGLQPKAALAAKLAKWV